MFNFQRASISQKLTMISVLSSGSALLLVFVAFAATAVLSQYAPEAVQAEGSQTRALSAPTPHTLLATRTAHPGQPAVNDPLTARGHCPILRAPWRPAQQQALPRPVRQARQALPQPGPQPVPPEQQRRPVRTVVRAPRLWGSRRYGH